MKVLKARPPKEAFEHQRLCMYLDSRGYKWSHIASESSSKAQRIKNARMGLKPGLPDFLIILPSTSKGQVVDQLVFVELKRLRGGRTSPEQKDWIAALNAAGIPAAVCAGFVAAKTWLEERA